MGTAKVKTVTPPNADKGEELGLSYVADGNVKWCSHCGKHYGGFLKKKKTKQHKPQLHMRRPHHPAIALLGIYLRGMKTYVHTVYTHLYSSF